MLSYGLSIVFHSQASNQILELIKEQIMSVQGKDIKRSVGNTQKYFGKVNWVILGVPIGAWFLTSKQLPDFKDISLKFVMHD